MQRILARMGHTHQRLARPFGDLSAVSTRPSRQSNCPAAATAAAAAAAHDTAAVGAATDDDDDGTGIAAVAVAAAGVAAAVNVNRCSTWFR